MPYDEDAFWVPFGGQSRWMAKPGAFAARAPKWLLAPPRTVHVIAQGTPRADDGFWCCDEGDSVLVVPLCMSPLATSPAPTFLTAPTSAVVTVADLLPRESAAPVLSAVATFTCSPSAALHDVAVLVPLFVLSMLVVVLTIVNVVVLYFGCRNGRQPERREVMQKVDAENLSLSDSAYSRRSAFMLEQFPESLQAPTVPSSPPPRFSQRSILGSELGTDTPLRPLRRSPSRPRQLPNLKWITSIPRISVPPPAYAPSCEAYEPQTATSSHYTDASSFRAESGEE
ncbi:hypothetical protein FOMPIDRAFT_1053507 [Fomitopsis schrenkii]|uniref:Uncharacterized protein n=1 Tax=Fomitopsis schrenkii TaxID=2126942 RepID=S8DSB8_FOMSC|nr:hypothetical protein FOMPIDRAFT_1053507 [Fomitopsis schrenkii]